MEIINAQTQKKSLKCWLASLETKKHYDDLRKHLFKENTATEAARNQLDPHKNPF